MLVNFFIWCAGSDKSVLSKCSDSEINKHIGFGTLVLIPAIIGLISMTYALSTIDAISNKPLLYRSGGILWGLIIFAFDRFIVSTHRKKDSNLEEFTNIFFYLRLFFATILGVIISHPIIMLNFDGSITESILKERNTNVNNAVTIFQMKYDTLTVNLNGLKLQKKCYEKLLTAEMSGNKVELDCGYSSGLPGHFDRTNEIKDIINKLENDIKKEEERIRVIENSLLEEKSNTQSHFMTNTSFDYLKREITLEKLKSENRIIVITQWLLMIMFILLDILPVTFKTFAPYGMYDKILSDDVILLKGIVTTSRSKVLQDAYEEISSVYAEDKNIKKPPEALRKSLTDLTKRYNFQTNILLGLIVGTVFYFFIITYYHDLSKIKVVAIFTISSIITSVLANFITEIIKVFTKLIKTK